MKERPILFSAPMVRAILDGTKTQTRRVVKPVGNDEGFILKDEGNGWWPYRSADGESGFYRDRYGYDMESPILCPYGKPGDLMWVRETFADLRGTGIEHRSDPAGPIQRFAFAADCPPGSYSDEARKEFGVKWKPSIHMPRAASRITLEITGVRVERLNDCSEADAKAEGIGGYPFRPDDGYPLCTGYMVGADDGKSTLYPTAREPYQRLWESINGAGSWDANPWVWMVEFKRLEAA